MAGKNVPWKITDQLSDQTRNTDASQTQVGMLIYFITGGGNSGVVFVPNNLRTQKHIEETVQKEANLLDLIGGMSQGTFPE